MPSLAAPSPPWTVTGKLYEDRGQALVLGIPGIQDQGLAQKEAMRRVAADRGLSRRDIYQQLKIK